jgi:hypothetical protein
MTQPEHILTIVEPTADGETPLAVARAVVERGGRATVAVLLTRAAMRNFRQAAEAEDLHISEALTVFGERLAQAYSLRVAGDHPELAPAEIVTEQDAGALFDSIGRIHATAVVIPQRFTDSRRWRARATTAPVPVILAPPTAA